MDTILDQHQDTERERARDGRKIFVRRRFNLLWLPLIAAGALVYLAASAATLTTNGLNLTGFALMAAGVLAAAWDAGDRR